jgi:hypothetical protein
MCIVKSCSTYQAFLKEHCSVIAISSWDLNMSHCAYACASSITCETIRVSPHPDMMALYHR